MKKLTLIALFVLSTTILFAQEIKKDAARVMKVKGIPVFVMSEPEREYETTGTVTDEDAESVLLSIGGETKYRTITESCEVIINNAQRKQKKGKLEFDAIIINASGHEGTCIKFK